MERDRYIEKSASDADVRAVVDEYLAKQRYHAALDEYFALTAKLSVTKANRAGEELDGDGRYAKLRDRVASKRREVDDLFRAGAPDWTTAFEGVETTGRERGPKRAATDAGQNA